MAKKKVEQKLKIGDLVSLAKSGWTPGEVNALLDRMDEVGDINDPDEPEDDEDIDAEDIDSEESDEDEDNNVSNEDDEDEKEDKDEDSSDDTKNKKKTTDKFNSLEVENTRLKKQLQRLQAKNRKKDVSGGDDDVPIEKSLINTFQSLFD